ncbi:hypothetical protein M33023_00320 [Candidatus Phytoplasma asteris]|uniref:Uncharacterized protein n=1 Tax=Candidatus Phytoplasma asteris TaxID=85620 RepID=A0ABZ2YG38_9MOLU
MLGSLSLGLIGLFIIGLINSRLPINKSLNKNPTLKKPTISKNKKLLSFNLKPLKTHHDIFQINYKNDSKNIIKELIGKINIHKIENLKLYQLDPNKLYKYNNPIKTNYKKGLNVVYYRQEDLKYIQFFLIKTKQGYRVKKDTSYV